MAVALTLCSCGGKKAQKGAAAVKEEQLPAVKVVDAKSEIVPIDEKYSVTLQACAINNIAPQSGGRITSIKAEVGDFV